MKVYCIRQKSTGLFIPRLKTGQRRGGSHLEPSNEREPRVFHSAAAARAFLGTWTQGIYENDTYVDSISGETEGTLKVIKQPHRNKDDMEIVEFECVPSYETTVGDAGAKYLDELIRYADGSRMLNDVWLPGTFRWEELFKRMIAAAQNKP